MRRKFFYLAGVLCAAMAMQSCIDNDYDLDDIDMTIGTNADLTLPKSSTGDIVLKNIMDLADDGVVQFVTDGQGQSYYAVMQDGRADIDPINIGIVSFKPELSKIAPVTINLRENVNPSPLRKKIHLTIPGLVGEDLTINDEDINFNYDLTGGAAIYSIDDRVASSMSSVSEDIISITHVGLEEDTKIRLNMNVTGFPDWLDNLTLSNMTLTYPQDLEISDCKLMGQDVVEIVPGRITLTDETGVKAPTDGSTITLELTITGIKEGNELKFNSDSHKISFGGKFELEGSFKIDATSINEAKLNSYLATATPETLVAIKTSGTLNSIMPDQITFEGDASFAGDGIVLKSFQGQLRHEIGGIDPIRLDDLPDFLNDDEVVLDLDNPILLFKASQGIPATVETALTLTSRVGNTTKTVRIDDVKIPGRGQDNYYYVADKELTDLQKALLPAEYKNATRLTVSAESGYSKVADLIKKIPEQIDVNVEPIKLDARESAIEITNYDVNVEYKVFAPLTLGEDFELVYRDTERDWAKDLDDFEDVDVSMLELKAKAVSNLPAGVTLKLTPIDQEGHKIEQLDVNEIVIDPSSNGSEQSTDVTFTIKGATINGHTYTINDALAGKNGVKQLDGVTYEARIDRAIAGTTLREEAKIVLKEIQVTLKGGITYDAN